MKFKMLMVMLSIIFHSASMELADAVNEQIVEINTDNLSLLEDIDWQALETFLRPYFETDDSSSLSNIVQVADQDESTVSVEKKQLESKRKSKKGYSVICYEPGCNQEITSQKRTMLTRFC